MNATCQFHPHQPAYWHCPRCRQSHCQQCVIRRPPVSPLSEHYFYLCPLCGDLSEFIGVARIHKPFWRRLPAMLRYPLAPRVLLFMAATALVGWGCSANTWVCGLSLNVLGLFILSYALEALIRTAKGDLSAPAIDGGTFGHNLVQVVQHYLLFLALGCAGILAFVEVSLKAGITYLILAGFMLPAMMMTLGMTRNIRQALNPIRAIRLALRIGGSYLLLVLLLTLCLATPLLLGQLALGRLPLNLHLGVYGLALSYFTIAAYHLMGYVILQYHERIGFEVDYEDILPPAAPSPAARPLTWNQETCKRANLMVAAGKLDEAIAVIQEATAKKRFDDLDLSERYLELLKLAGRGDALDRHAPRHLWLLVKAGRKAAACRLYRELLEKDPEFSPHPAQLYELAGWLGEKETPQAALGTLKRLVRIHPDDPLVPKAYFRIAQILHDRLKDSPRAKQILDRLLNRYPDHEIAPQVKTYLLNL
ncbi:MAG: tetratricopeptide repeat protein [Desulfobacterales bacterium]